MDRYSGRACGLVIGDLAPGTEVRALFPQQARIMYVCTEAECRADCERRESAVRLVFCLASREERTRGMETLRERRDLAGPMF
jgi:hypothetical protein